MNRSKACVLCKLRKVKCTGRPPPCESCRRLQLDCRFPDPAETSNGAGAWLVSPTRTRTEAGTARRRLQAACDECRAQKARCSGDRPQCSRCCRRNMDCVYRNSSRGGNFQRAMSRSLPEDSSYLSSSVGGPDSTILSPSSLDTATDHRFLARDIMARHIEAYFEYLYHLPGYDFLHRPTILHEFHNDTLAPVLCKAICAAVAMYVSSSPDSRRLSVSWAKDIDGFVSTHLNNLSILNLQIMVLSMFQHFAYRQFGRVWLMQGMASRLALSLQLNLESSSPSDVAVKECSRRLMWSLFYQDKTHAGGVEEFVALPARWMRISLPLCENDFQLELDKHLGFIYDGLDTLVSNGLGTNGYLMLIQDLRYDILKTTKNVLHRNPSPLSMEPNDILVSLTKLEQKLGALYASLPPRLRLSDRNILAHSTHSEFATYIAFHTWYFQGCCDLFRICLPGLARESASIGFLEQLPNDLVVRWRFQTVSYAVTLAKIWLGLGELKSSGALSLPGGQVPLSPDILVCVYQCTKVLLTARSYQLYSNLNSPVSGEPMLLDDRMVESLCQSNIAFIDGLATIAPIAAAVRRDIKEMLDKDKTQLGTEQAPVTSDVQREKILSRYHPLAMGIAASSSRDISQDGMRSEDIEQSGVTPGFGTMASNLSGPQLEQNRSLGLGNPDRDGFINGVFWEGFPADYSFTLSDYDMGGELDLFLFNTLQPQ